jgi:hypothetical protein
MTALEDLFDFLLRLFGLREEKTRTSEFTSEEDEATASDPDGDPDPTDGGDTTTDTGDGGPTGTGDDSVTGGGGAGDGTGGGDDTTTGSGDDTLSGGGGGGTSTDPDGGVTEDPTGTGSSSDGGAGQVISLAGDAAPEVYAGRVATLQHEGDVASIRVVERPDVGNLTVNPDNTLALVLTGTDDTGPLSFTYEVTYADGSVETVTESVNVIPGLQAAGWGVGDHYMLQTDAAGDVIVEHGDNHRLLHISGSEDALSREDIAALEGVSVDTVTAEWLAANTDYGTDPSTALEPSIGEALWREISGELAEPNSNWLLLEKGFSYSFNRLVDEGTIGESELHPVYIGAYGEGTDPLVTSELEIFQAPSMNLVIQGLDFSGGAFVSGAANILFDDLTVTGSTHFVLKSTDDLTFRNSELLDVFRDQPVDGGDFWEPDANRISAIYASGVDGLLLEDLYFNQIGWEDGYDFDGSSSSGQPPSKFSHALYIQSNNMDVTLRDSILMEGASFGSQFRSGGFVEDNAFIDNNAAIFVAGGTAISADSDIKTGNYSLLLDNLVTSAAHKDGSDLLKIGAYSLGIDSSTPMISLVDNIVTHLSDPNNPEELEYKFSSRPPLRLNAEAYYNDTIIYNWGASNSEDLHGKDTNVDGLDQTILDQTTIQNFTAQILGQETATIQDLADYLRAQADGAFDDVVDADLIIAFFQQGFGLTPDIRAEAETLRFVPNDLADGVRWDNRLNWTTQDTPGTQDGDSVDLAGNWVQYGGTTTIESLDFGSGGRLTVTSGYLQIDGEMTAGEWGGQLVVDDSGQVWSGGYTDTDFLSIDLMGGRFANTGFHSGHTDLTVGDNAQAILASDGAEMSLGAGDALTILGGDAKVGFDGNAGGTGVLDLHEGATLTFTAENGEIGAITEFRSGHLGDSVDIRSGVDLGGSALEIDVTALSTLTDATLIEVDEIIGQFGSIDVLGLGSDRDLSLTVDYDSDTLKLSLGASGSGSGAVSVDYVGDELSAMADSQLWSALTTDMVEEAVEAAAEEDPDVIAA